MKKLKSIIIISLLFFCFSSAKCPGRQMTIHPYKAIIEIIKKIDL